MPQRRRTPTPTVVEDHIDAPIEDVFAVLSDGWLFPLWVVGATHMRDVDANWPAPGSELHHEVGAWPMTVSDRTRSLECEAPHHLVLQAAARPLLKARIEMRLSSEGRGTLVRMSEAPTGGLARALDNPLQRKVLAARNRECLVRLAAIAQNRSTD
jgi:uncharacterized protein YndB with AHSA1/START domain